MSRNDGFTLIESLISLTLVIILAGALYFLGTSIWGVIEKNSDVADENSDVIIISNFVDECCREIQIPFWENGTDWNISENNGDLQLQIAGRYSFFYNANSISFQNGNDVRKKALTTAFRLSPLVDNGKNIYGIKISFPESTRISEIDCYFTESPVGNTHEER